MAIETALDERETNFTIEATDRNCVRVFSNDTVWQLRIEKLGIIADRESGYGKFYTIDLKEFNFSIRPRRKLNEEQRAVLRERLAGNLQEVDEDDAE
jgi:hypothetical protein